MIRIWIGIKKLPVFLLFLAFLLLLLFRKSLQLLSLLLLTSYLFLGVPTVSGVPAHQLSLLNRDPCCCVNTCCC